VNALHERIDDLGKAREQLAERLSEQERELDGLRGRARSALARERAGLADEVCTASEVADEEVEMELLRRRRGAGEVS